MHIHFRRGVHVRVLRGVVTAKSDVSYFCGVCVVSRWRALVGRGVVYVGPCVCVIGV